MTPTCFLDDLTIKNVLVDDAGQLCGVVDLDVVAYGDPRLHIGLCAAAVTAFMPSRCQFYVDEPIRISELTSTQRAIVGLYQANYLVSFLGAESPEDRGPWRKAALAGVDRGLNAFGARFGLSGLPSACPPAGLNRKVYYLPQEQSVLGRRAYQ